MNWYSIFYWLTVADNARGFFWFFAIVFSLIAIIGIIVYWVQKYEEEIDAARQARKWFWWAFPFMMFFWFAIIFTPAKRDALLIIAGGGTMEFLSNDSTAKQIPHEMVNFVQAELKAMAIDAKVEFLEAKDNYDSRKVRKTIEDRVMNEAKTMNTTQLINRMNSDTAFARIVIEKGLQ